MSTKLTCALFAIVAACSGSKPPKSTESPAPSEAEAAEPTFSLGEATIYELPANKPVFKLHTSGPAEIFAGNEWKSVGIDDSFDNDLIFDGNRIKYVTKGLPTATVELTADGTMMVSGRQQGGPRWRIEAADPAVMKTAFYIYGASIESKFD